LPQYGGGHRDVKTYLLGAKHPNTGRKTKIKRRRRNASTIKLEEKRVRP